VLAEKHDFPTTSSLDCLKQVTYVPAKSIGIFDFVLSVHNIAWGLDAFSRQACYHLDAQMPKVMLIRLVSHSLQPWQ